MMLDLRGLCNFIFPVVVLISFTEGCGRYYTRAMTISWWWFHPDGQLNSTTTTLSFSLPKGRRETAWKCFWRHWGPSVLVTFKYHLLRSKEQSVPKCWKLCRWGRRRLAGLHRDLLELRRKKKAYGHWTWGWVTWKGYGDAVCHCREKICVTKA